MIHMDRLHRCLLAVAIGLALATALPIQAEYVDHRGHNIDSLEAVLAAQPPLDAELSIRDQLMNAYLESDLKKSLQHARTLVRLTDPTDEYVYCANALRIIGQHFYANELYDSAACYYARAITKMQHVAPQEGSVEPDNMLSVLYGSLGNLMNIQDSVREAEHYYRQALEIFERRHWDESTSLAWYNMAEMYASMDDSPFHALGYEGTAAAYAYELYGRSKEAALLTADSFFVVKSLYGMAKALYYMGDCPAALPMNTEALDYLSRYKDDDEQGYQDALQLQSNLLIRTGDIAGADAVLNILDAEKDKARREYSQKLLCEGEEPLAAVIGNSRKPLRPIVIVVAGMLLAAMAIWFLSRRNRKKRPVEMPSAEPFATVPSADPIAADPIAAEPTDNVPPMVSAAAPLSFEKEAVEEVSVPDDRDEAVEGETVVVTDDLKLSDQELTVLRLLSEGKTTPQIAAAVYRSTDTVRWYRKRLLQKFDVHNTAALIKAASERGLI